MVSKGIDVYSYCNISTCKVVCSVPGPGGKLTTFEPGPANGWQKTHFEIDKKNLGFFHWTGRFQWEVLDASGKQLATGHNDISTLSGSTEGGTMVNTKQTKAIILDGLIITYGFYNAGPGEAHLPSSHQFYIAVGHDNNKWMERVAPPLSPAANKPISKFVLPFPHDAGMNTTQFFDAVVSRLTGEKMAALMALFGPLGWFADLGMGVVKLMAPSIIYGLAITQKDTTATHLALGARYFEFRPACLHKTIRENDDNLYFQHACIPGARYDAFLSDIITFLNEHPNEVVVVHLRWDGVIDGCERPTKDILTHYIGDAITTTKTSLKVGDMDDLANPKTTIQSLRDANKRLIIVQDKDSDSNYGDGNTTLNGDSIVVAMQKLEPSHNPQRFVNLQCQATATNIKDVVVYSVLASGASTSCLTATKPICDSKTNAWIKDFAPKKFDISPQVVVICNDFLDAGTVDRAIEWTVARLGAK